MSSGRDDTAAPVEAAQQSTDSITKKSARRTAGGLFSFFVVRCSGSVMGALVIVVMTRALSRSDFGTFSLALTLTQLVTTFSDSGINSLLTRETIARPQIERALVGWAVAVKALVGAALAAIAWLVSAGGVDPGADRVAVGLVLLTVPLVSYSVLLNSLSRHLILGTLAILTFIQSALWLGVAIVLSARGAGLLAFSTGYLASALAFGGLVLVVAPRAVPFPLSRRHRSDATPLSLREGLRLLTLAIPLGISAALVALYAKIDGVLLYQIVGADKSAPYALAFRFLDQLAIFPLTLGTVYGPLLNHSVTSNMTLRYVLERWIRLTLLVSVPVTAFLIASASSVVEDIFGSEYQDSVILLQILAPSFVLISLGWVVTGLAIATRRGRGQLVVAALGLAFNVALNLCLIPVFGAKAAALTTFLTEVFVVVLMAWVVRTHLVGAIPNIQVFIKIAVITLAAAASAMILPLVAGLAATVVILSAGAFGLKLFRIEDVTAGRA